MAVTVDFVVVTNDAVVVVDIVAGLLEGVYTALYEDSPSADELKASIDLRYARALDDGRHINGISATVDEAAADDVGADVVVSEITQALLGAVDLGILHAVKCGDPVMFSAHQRYAEEICEIEMRLREALTVIFIETYGENYYALLTELKVRFPGNEEPAEQQMQAAGENQFFFLLFSDYLNFQKRIPTDANGLRDIILGSTDFAELQNRLSPELPMKEEYQDFLAAIKPYVGPVEKVRNAVAHNRSIPITALQHYAQARPPLIGALDAFFAGL